MSRRGSRVLVVAYSYPPDTSVSAPRMSHLVSELSARGYDVTVVTSALPTGHETERILFIPDPVLESVAQIGRHNAAASKDSHPHHATNSRARNALDRALFLTRHTVVPALGVIDRQSLWAARAEFTLRNRVSPAQRPDLIVVSSPPFSALGMARRLGKRWRSVIAADVRDLWLPTTESNGILFATWRKQIDELTRRRLKGCQLITTVSPNIQQELKISTRLHATLIENGVDPREWKGVHPSASGPGKSLVYTGKLYPEYETNLRDVLNGLKKVDQSAEWILHYYGPDGGYLTDIAEKHGARSRVRDHGAVDTATSHGLQLGAHALLLLSGNESGPITTKVYDYIASGRPILCIGNQHNDASALLQRSARFFRVCSSTQEVHEAINEFSAKDSNLIGPEFPKDILRTHRSHEWVDAIEASIS